MSLKTLLFNIPSKIHFKENLNLLNIRRCLILRHCCINDDNMTKSNKNKRKRSRDPSKLIPNKCYNSVANLTDGKPFNKYFNPNTKVLNNIHNSNKEARFPQSVIEISSDSQSEQKHTHEQHTTLTTKTKKRKLKKRQQKRKIKKLRKLRRQLKNNSTFRLEETIRKLNETLKDRLYSIYTNSVNNPMESANMMNLHRTYSDSALQSDSCLGTNMYWQPYTSYLPQCDVPVRNLVDEIGTKKKYKPKPQRALSMGDVANSTNNYIDNVAQEKERLKDFRQWDYTNYGKILYKSGQAGGLLFKLMSYNVLAQILLTQHPYLYRQHDPRALFWEHRKFALMREFMEHDADILCLQEVEKTHLDSFYNTLHLLGYKGMFKSRTGIRIDGCAIYYKANKFNLIEYTTVEYFQPNIEILNRENIAIIARFSDKLNPSNEFVVATTHLLYNPKRQDVRLAQTQLLLAEIDRIAFKKLNENNSPEYVPIIITGDFNLEPYTAVYNLLINGELEYSRLTRRQLNPPTGLYNETLMGPKLLPRQLRITDYCQHADIALRRSRGSENMNRSSEIELIQLEHSDRLKSTVNLRRDNLTESKSLFSTGKLTHGFNLKSVYTHDNRATTYQNKWITVDYIFYSAKSRQEGIQQKSDDRLKLISKYQLPTANECRKLGSIPNLVFGSDHLALAAQFLLENP